MPLKEKNIFEHYATFEGTVSIDMSTYVDTIAGWSFEFYQTKTLTR